MILFRPKIGILGAEDCVYHTSSVVKEAVEVEFHIVHQEEAFLCLTVDKPAR